MQLVPITARCPTCGSTDAIYSCNPHCCFNHVCGDCRTSWQLGTVALGDTLPGLDHDPGDYDTAYPTAPCAGCGSLVFQIEGGEDLCCPHCRARLRLAYTAVQAFTTRGPVARAARAPGGGEDGWSTGS